MDVLVSIIIPVYNVKPYIKEALDSVIRQTYQNLEIILIDDGSTDGSGEICDEYARKDSRITVVHQENRGASAARNAGMERMHGEFVAFLDPDDAYDSQFISTMMEAMNREEHPDLVVCRYTIHRSPDSIERTGGEEVQPPLAEGLYDRKSALRALADDTINQMVWNKLYRRELWDGIRFPEGHNFEDIDVIFRVFDRCETVCMLDGTFYRNRKRPESITFTYSLDNIKDKILALTHFTDFVEEHTPDVFDETILSLRRSGVIRAMISGYLHTLSMKASEHVAYRKILRVQILETGRKYGLDGCGRPMRVAYWMLRWCPWALGALYSVYNRR